MIKPPLIQIDGSDIIIYESIEEAESDTEPQDIKDEDLRIFDAEGYQLLFVLSIHKRKRKLLFWEYEDAYPHVSICEIKPTINKKEELRNIIITYLLKQKKYSLSNLEERSLHYLIDEVRKYVDYRLLSKKE
jgi:hypothetical protein